MLARLRAGVGAACGGGARAGRAPVRGRDALPRELDRRATGWRRRMQGSGSAPGPRHDRPPDGCEFYLACLAHLAPRRDAEPCLGALPELNGARIVETASPALVVGAPAASATTGASVPRASCPTPALSDAPLPDVVSRCVRAMTSGGSTGVRRSSSTRCRPSATPRSPRTGSHRAASLSCRAPSTTGALHDVVVDATRGGTAVVMRQFDAERALA